MSLKRRLIIIASLFFAAGAIPATAQPGGVVASQAQWVPDATHSNQPLPPGFLNWDQTQKAVDATNGQDFAWFTFYFTNVNTKIDMGLATNINYTTNFTVVTNHSFWDNFMGRKYASIRSVITNQSIVSVTNSITQLPLAIFDAHASCGCTQPQLPPERPWILPPGTNGSIRVSVNLLGKMGTLYKTVTITTDHGRMDLVLRVAIAPPPPVKPMSPEERAQGIAAAKLDRQAVFKGDCASCHAKNLVGQYGQQLFKSACAVCHEADPRATMVPDLHNLKDPTSEEFWRTWITSGKAGTLMPAFSTSQGGPLNDMQIASLAVYLNQAIPSKARPVPAAAGAK
jgi:mono/diheme cytochrome c family protein